METAPDHSPPPGEKPPTIVIVGGGFTGAAAAAALMARVQFAFDLKIIDTRGKLGEGIAYGDARDGDLLNVRSEDMRLRADIPGDFACWLAGEDLIDSESSVPFSYYAPRRTFGEFVRNRLALSIASRPDASVEHVRQEAVEIARGDRRRYIVLLQTGRVIDADIVILATGYGTPRAPRFGYGAYEQISAPVLRRSRSAAIVGSGLSAIDAALFLAEAAPHINIRLISRRGIRPMAQSPGPALSKPWTEPLPSNARSALAAVRREVLNAAADGKNWRAVLNGLRPVTQAIWMGFPDREKRRFWRHLKSYWDAIRHRMPSQTASRITELEDAGRLAFVSGVVREGLDGKVTLRQRGARDFEPMHDDIIIDCTGHRPDLESSAIQSLIGYGLAVQDALGIGIAVAEDGLVLNRSNEPSIGLFALGPLGAGSLLEITASPEIATQAAAAANQIHLDIGAAAFTPRVSEASSAHRAAKAR